MTYNKSLIVIDVETSGTCVATSSIIQLGAVKLDKSLSTVDKWQSYIQPYTEEWSERSEQCHHITREFLHKQGQTLRFALLSFVDWVGQPKDYYLAQWSIGFDTSMLHNAFIQGNIPDPFSYRSLDIASIVRFFIACSGYSSNKNLHQCAKFFNIDTQKYKQHDALDDALITVECLHRVRDLLVKKNDKSK